VLESSSVPLVAETYVRGLHIDQAALATLDKQLEEASNVAFVKLKLDTPEVTPELLASPKQLGDLLYTDWRLPVVKMTEKGQFSTDRESLRELALLDPRAKLVDEYREANGNRAKFVTSTSESLAYNGDGCTRPQAKIYGTYTGRMTYYSKQGKGKDERPTGVALHQWKRDPAFRRLITPPPGHTLLEFDFAGQEFRWMAVMARDPTMLQLCGDGEDAHSFMGARISGLSYEQLRKQVAEGVKGAKDKRQLGKVANLSLQYRTSAKTLMTVARTQYSLPMKEKEAKAIHATYLTTYLQVPNYWDKQIYMAKKYGWVETLAGRRVSLRSFKSNTKMDASTLQWARDSTSINFPIQGVGADQKYLALAVLRKYLPEVNGHFYFELHDGMFVVVPDKYAERAVHEIKALLSNLPYQKAWGVSLPIQFPVDAKMGKSWGDLKEIK
jgi:DNA polymerase-1